MASNSKMYKQPVITWIITAWTIGISLVAIVLLGGSALADEAYGIDPEHSSIVFRIKHLGITFVYGVFPNACGRYAFDDENLENAFIWIKVRVADINTGNETRDQHLRSPDFFDEERFPDIIFKSVSITASDAGEYLVTGELSLHGVIKQVTVRARKTGLVQALGGEYRSGFETRFSIKRSDYGMKYMAVVADTVKLSVNVEGIRTDSSLPPSDGKESTFGFSCE